MYIKDVYYCSLKTINDVLKKSRTTLYHSPCQNTCKYTHIQIDTRKYTHVPKVKKYLIKVGEIFVINNRVIVSLSR